MAPGFFSAKASNRNCGALSQRPKQLNRLPSRRLTKLALIRLKELSTNCGIVPVATTVPKKQPSTWGNDRQPDVEIAVPLPTSLRDAARRPTGCPDPQALASLRWRADLKGSKVNRTFHTFTSGNS